MKNGCLLFKDPMVHIFCEILNDNDADFNAWLKFHRENCVDFRFVRNLEDRWKFYSDVLNGKTDLLYFDHLGNAKHKFEEGDIIIFLTEFQYLWYDKTKFESLECALKPCFKQLGCLLLPKILLSTHHLMQGRSDVCPKVCYYRRNEEISEGEAAVWYQPWVTYSYNHEETNIGHVPWIDKRRFSEILGSDKVSKDIYGKCNYDYPVRLYEFAARSESEGVPEGKIGKYDIPDMTVKNALELS